MTQRAITQISADSDVRFGTSGARGLAEALTDDVCNAYTATFLQGVESGAKQVVVGCDLRPSSPRIAAACAAAIHATGAQVIFAGVVPTPALAYYAARQGLPALMITGSHIPFDRNGIKFYRHDGEIDKTDEARILAQTVHLPNPCTMPLPAVEAAVLRVYQDRYQAFFPDGFLRGRRIAVFQHSSVARDLLVDLLNWFGADTVAVGRSDVFVPVDTEAVGEETQALGLAWASEHQVDGILSTDGDADRPLIADERGKWLRGDTVGLLCARYLRARTVVTPVSSNTAIERCSAFDTVLRTRIGSPYVIAAMNHALAKGQKAVVGFEANGGFLVGDAIRKDGRHLDALPTRDAVLPMLALLALAHENSVPLSHLAAGLPQRFTASDRIQGIPTEHSRTLIVRLATSPAAVARWLGESFGAPVAQDETDGLRLTFSNGEIIHLRPSGNAPELRCYAEAASEARAKALVRHALERINRP